MTISFGALVLPSLPWCIAGNHQFSGSSELQYVFRRISAPIGIDASLFVGIHVFTSVCS